MTTNAEKQRRIEMRIDYTPEYRLARRMIETMSADYGFDVNVIFSNRERTCVTQWNPARKERYTIRLGYQFIDAIYNDRKRGSARTSQDQLFGDPVFGLEAIYRIAIHEFAHAVQIKDFVSDPDTIGHRLTHHGYEWMDNVDDLVELYPFSEMESFARPWTDPETQTED